MTKTKTIYNFEINKNGVLLLLGCFIFHYFFFFFVPHLITKNIFFNYDVTPPGRILGMDYFETLRMASEPLAIAYSPLADLIFKGLSFFSFANSYLFISLLSIFSFVMAFYMQIEKIFKQQLSVVFLAALIGFGIYSYPFMFEIERGQWNIIAIAIALVGIFGMQRRLYLIAAGCIAVATSLKIFPLVFAASIISFRPNFKEILRFSIYLTGALILAFFIRGVSYFKWFIRWLANYSDIKSTWIGNHSIKSFTMQLGNSALSPVFLCIIGIVLLAACYLAWKQKSSWFHFHFLSILAICACVIPNVSHDYKISLLILFMPLLLAKRIGLDHFSIKEGIVLFLITIIYLYLLTPYSATYYTGTIWLHSKFPSLLLLGVLLLTDGFFLLQKQSLNLSINKSTV